MDICTIHYFSLETLSQQYAQISTSDTKNTPHNVKLTLRDGHPSTYVKIHRHKISSPPSMGNSDPKKSPQSKKDEKTSVKT